jgi:L-Ala-D/L-Glu epimerase
MELTAHLQPLTYEFPFVVSSFAKAETTTVIIELSYQSENVTCIGLGEAVPVELYQTSPQQVMAFYEMLNQARFFETLNPFEIQRLHARLKDYPGHMAAKAAIDMAFYDLQGKLLNKPLWQLWGLDAQRCPKSSYTIGMGTLETVIHKTQIALARGYDILKIKLGCEKDIEQFNAIRELARHCTLRVDANAAWPVGKALEMCSFLAGQGVEFVEEPLLPDSTTEDYQLLKEQSPLPLMADERCHTSEDLDWCHQYYHAVNLKPCKTGGLTEARKIIDIANHQGLKVMLGGFGETSVSVTAFAQLAPLVDYCDLDAALLLSNDPYEGLVFKGSSFMLPCKPGLGVSLR